MANKGEFQEKIFLQMSLAVTASLRNSLLQLAGEQRKVLCHGWTINGLALSVHNE